MLQQWLAEVDDANIKPLRNQAEGQHLALMDLKSVIALLELREKKLQEFADSLKPFTSDKVGNVKISVSPIDIPALQHFLNLFRN